MRPATYSSLEVLEDRIAPASLFQSIGKNYVTYKTAQGYLVTVTFSKDVITTANAGSIFSLVPDQAGAQLESINVANAAAAVDLVGMNITVTAKGSTVNVGAINSGNINLGNVKVGGDLGAIVSGNLNSLTVDSMGAFGTTTQGGGQLVSTIHGNLTKLTVAGNVDGEEINVTGNIGTVVIDGNLDASTLPGTANAGSIIAAKAFGSITVTGNVIGSSGTESGYIAAGGALGPVKIGGNLVGGSATSAGEILGSGGIGPVTISGNIQGGSAAFTGAVQSGASLTSLTVSKDITAGATVRAQGEIGKLSVKGGIGGTSAAPVIISAQGVANSAATADMAIGSITVGQDMSYAVVLAGYDTILTAQDPNAQIGSVSVTGNFTASDVVAGVRGTVNSGTFEFGTASDASISGGVDVVLPAIISKIASVKIGGTAAGDGSSNTFGITAGYVESVKVGTTVEPLQHGAENDLFSTSKQLPLASNLTVDEVTESSIFDAVKGNLVQYTDVDGDIVTVNFSKSFITSANVTKIFQLVDSGVGAQLETLDLAAYPSADTLLYGMNVSITAKTPPGGKGDGKVNVGAINASGIGLGTVTVGGDLGEINVGSTKHPNALTSLTLDGFGTLGVTTQAAGGSLQDTFRGSISTLTVNGNVDGEDINILGNIGTISIKGNLDASTQPGVSNAGSIFVSGGINAVSITGNVIGNAAQYSGEIQAVNTISNINIGGNLDGSAGAQGDSGYIVSSSFLQNVSIGGDVIGGAGDYSGALQAGLGMGTVTISGSLKGGAGSFAGGLNVRNSVTSLTVGGMTAGATVRAGEEIGKLNVTGSITGTYAAPVIISAQGNLNPNAGTDVAIGNLSVQQNMTYGVVLAGYDRNLTAQDPNAQIGPVNIGGNFTASDVVAGVQGTMNGNNFVFGTGSDAAINTGSIPQESNIDSKIASVTIGGSVAGDANSGAFYGITAEYIVSASVNSTSQPLKSGPGNDLFSTSSEISLASNVTLDEVPV